MTQTFDIRFARSAGLAALLEVPENVFRWKGGGHLHIDAQGISISVKRGLLALLGGKRTQRIPTENLRAVYREGDALRVEFQSGKESRVVVPFWADDRDTAARIVRLLPTAQTVEIEEATRHAKARADWRMLMLLALALAMLVLGTWAVFQWTRPPALAAPGTEEHRVDLVPPAPAESTSIAASQVDAPASAASSSKAVARNEAPAFPLNAPLSPSQARPTPAEPRGTSSRSSLQDPDGVPDASSSSESRAGAASTTMNVRPTSEGVVPIVPGMPAYEAARRQLDLFLAESSTLRGYYGQVRYETDAKRFDKIAGLWWKVSNRVSNSPDMENPDLRALQELELAVSRAWRRAFAMYRDPSLLAVADAEVEFAEMLEARARELVN